MAGYAYLGGPPQLPMRPANGNLVSQAAQQGAASQYYYPDGHPTQPNRSRAPPSRPQKPARLSAAEVARQAIQKEGDELTFDKNDIIIAVMGVTGAGKSTFISLLSDAAIEIGHGLQSCTTAVGVYCYMLNGVRVWLIDTPGFDDTNRSDAEVLKDVAFWLAAAYTRKTQLTGIIYLHKITDGRMLGSAKRNLRMFKQLCGPDNLRCVILVTTHWSDKEGKCVPEDVGQQRIKELVETNDFWGEMVQRGSTVMKHDGTKKSAHEIVSELVGRQVRVTLDIQKDLIDLKKSLFETNAGRALQAELIEERQRSEARLAELKEDMKFALQEKDEKWQKQINEDRAQFEAGIQRGKAEIEELKTNIEKMAEEKEAKLRDVLAKMSQDRKNFEAQIEASTRAIEAFKEEQRKKEAEYQRKKQEHDELMARQAEEHRERLAAEEKRIRSESDRQRREDMERQKQEMQEQYERAQERANAAAEERRQEWERQQAEYERREAEVERERAATERRLNDLILESRKSKAFLWSTVIAVTQAVSGLVQIGLAISGAGVSPF